MAQSNSSIVSLSLQGRDLALLRALFESRIMTAKHVATLHFNGSGEAAKKRLQKLKSAGFIGERRERVTDPSILFLTRKSILLLKDKGILLEYPNLSSFSIAKRASVSEGTLQHELEVMDVKAAFHSAMRPLDKFSIEEFTTWPLLCQFEVSRLGLGGKEVTVSPDGFIRIHEKGDGTDLFQYSFFLELDRSSERQSILVAKAAGYFDHYQSGGYALQQGADRSAFKEHQFRILMIFKNAERRNNTAERLLQHRPRLSKQPYLSTFEEVIANPLGEIWIRPAAYLEATKDTQFEPREERQLWGYRTQTEREIFVERNLKKRSILCDEVGM